MKFAAQGKRSRAWWLQAVKWFGKDGNKGIMRGGEVPTHQVKEAMQELLGAQYVRREGGGRGKRDLKYHLTETGNRYLIEHEAELEAPAEPVRHEVPAGFTDPYNCSFCARKGALCDMHERFQRDQQAKQAAAQQPAAAPKPAAEKPTPKSNILRRAVSDNRASLNTPEKPEKPPIPAAAPASNSPAPPPRGLSRMPSRKSWSRSCSSNTPTKSRQPKS